MEEAVPGNETILLVEDEAAILKMTTTQFECLGYTVLAAATPGEAITLARKNARVINLLVTDRVMPEMDGRNLAKNLLSLCPDLKILFMSGYTTCTSAYKGVLEEGANFIRKPFTGKEISIKVRESLAS